MLSLSFLWADCGHRGWYDNPQSALRPHTGVAQYAIVPDVRKLTVNGWCVTLSETGVCCVGGTLMLYVYCTQPWLFRFSRRWPSVHRPQLPSSPVSAHPSQQGCISSPWCIQEPGVAHMADCAVGTHYSSGALIPECNGLSQFNEDIGEPSVPVREFNLIALTLVQSS